MPQVDIKSIENGPNVILVDGKTFTVMCRCGGSKNAPYCDGTHAKVDFSAPATETKIVN
jgi:CDGSH-type Zn-finger protein